MTVGETVTPRFDQPGVIMSGQGAERVAVVFHDLLREPYRLPFDVAELPELDEYGDLILDEAQVRAAMLCLYRSQRGLRERVDTSLSDTGLTERGRRFGILERLRRREHIASRAGNLAASPEHQRQLADIDLQLGNDIAVKFEASRHLNDCLNAGVDV